MPLYDFRCSNCRETVTLRRLISEFDTPAVHLSCGEAMQRMFVPTNKIQVPIAFRQVMGDGSLGGGSLSWSDFHSDNERDLARKNPNLLTYNEFMSQPGVSDPHARRNPSPDERPSSVAPRAAFDE